MFPLTLWLKCWTYIFFFSVGVKGAGRHETEFVSIWMNHTVIQNSCGEHSPRYTHMRAHTRHTNISQTVPSSLPTALSEMFGPANQIESKYSKGIKTAAPQWVNLLLSFILGYFWDTSGWVIINLITSWCSLQSVQISAVTSSVL